MFVLFVISSLLQKVPGEQYGLLGGGTCVPLALDQLALRIGITVLQSGNVLLPSSTQSSSGL